MIGTAHLRWTETVEDGEPTGLEGTLEVGIEDDEGTTLAHLSRVVSGAPDTLTAQLDTLLEQHGWQRVGAIHSWWELSTSDAGPDTNAAGQCTVRRR